MPTLALTETETQVVREVLTSYHHTLLLELSKAKHLQFREMLRAREAVVAGLLARLTPVSAP